MFDHTHYVPFLKGKDAEFRTLLKISEKEDSRFTPLVELADAGGAGKMAEKLAGCWTLTPDRSLPPRDPPTRKDRQIMVFLAVRQFYSKANEKGLPVVPVIGPTSRRWYVQATMESSDARERGICFRFGPEDLGDSLEDDLNTLLAKTEIKPQDVDLIIDFGAVAPGHGASILLAARAVLSILPRLSAWRSLILSASGFPEGLAGFAPNSVSTTPRTEWILWLSLMKSQLKRLPTFGDYAIQHPHMIEFDPLRMSFSAQLRYTAEHEWLILKGKDARRHGFDQFNDLCKMVIERPEYCGTEFSWGDFYIYKCAHNQDGLGNATTWRQVGTTHHIEFVARPLASYFAA